MARIEDFLTLKYDAAPKERIGIGGFTAMVRINTKVTKTAVVPVSVVEDGTFEGDHVIIDPVKISIQGEASDVFVEASSVMEDLKRTQASVGTVTQYLPARTVAELQQISGLANDLTDSIRAADAFIEAGEQVNRFFGNQDSTSKSNRELFLDKMDALYLSRIPFAIDTDFRRYNSMIITSLVTQRDNQTNAVKFSIEATEFRLASTVFTELVSAPAPSTGVNGQLDSLASKGPQSGTPVNQSLLFTLFGG